MFQSNAQGNHAGNRLDQGAGGADRSYDRRNGQGLCLVAGKNVLVSNCHLL